MNKYQEAINILKSSYTGLINNEALSILQELVNRATPKQPHRLLHEKMSGLNWYHCPICNKLVGSIEKGRYAYKLDFCPSCGQALDWGEKNAEFD